MRTLFVTFCLAKWNMIISLLGAFLENALKTKSPSLFTEHALSMHVRGKTLSFFFKPAAPCMLCFRGRAFSRLGNLMVWVSVKMSLIYVVKVSVSWDFLVSVSVSVSKIVTFKSQSQYRYRKFWFPSLSLSLNIEIKASKVSVSVSNLKIWYRLCLVHPQRRKFILEAFLRAFPPENKTCPKTWHSFPHFPPIEMSCMREKSH